MTPSHQERRGAAAVEFGLTMPVLLLLLAGIVDGGFLMSRHHVLARTARDAARIGATTVEDYPADGSQIEAAAEDFVNMTVQYAGLDPDKVQADAQWKLINNRRWIHLRITAEHEPLFPFSPFLGPLEHEFWMITQEQDSE